jgi:16S rRNA (cytidine1402-2'-O)-methyltransferase
MGTPIGTLHVVGTPIGNLEDITFRAVRVLSEVHVIAAEDTRVTRRLLQRYHIETPLMSYHQHTSGARRAQIVDMLRAGKSVALVSDAGMPGFSDPGAALVEACLEANIPVTVAPGPTASSAALAISGFSGREHVFLGFLPAKSGDRKAALERVAQQPGALIAYEAPHRLVASMTDMRAVLGDRRAVCARELTKKFEEIARGTLCELIQAFTEKAPRGEFTVIVESAPAARESAADVQESAEEVRELIELGLSRSRAVSHVARKRGLSRSALYAAVHQEGDGS